MRKSSERKRDYPRADERLFNWSEYRLDVTTFSVFVGSDTRADAHEESPISGVSYAMADRFEQNLQFLSALDSKRPITIYLSSEGGVWEDGMQMFGALLACPNPTTIVGLKHCRSMTSIIPLAADKFIMRPPTEYMIHYGTWGYDGLAGEEASSAIRSLERSNKTMLQIYCARLKSQGKFKGKSTVEIEKHLRKIMRKEVDAFFSTTEAVEMGFADGLCIGPVTPAAEINTERRQAMLAALAWPTSK